MSLLLFGVTGKPRWDVLRSLRITQPGGISRCALPSGSGKLFEELNLTERGGRVNVGSKNCVLMAENSPQGDNQVLQKHDCLDWGCWRQPQASGKGFIVWDSVFLFSVYAGMA